jgi:sugar lactone lactonase YvrE
LASGHRYCGLAAALAVCLLLPIDTPAAAAPTVSYASQWGGAGTGDGQFNQPESIATDPSGNVYVVDTGNNRVQKFSPNGAFITKWGGAGSADGQFNYPGGIAVSPDDNVYVADTGNHRIQEFSSDGTFVRKWGEYGTGAGQFRYPFGLAADPNTGNVYVSDGFNRIQVFTPTGAFTGVWIGSNGSAHGEFAGIMDAAADRDRNLYIADVGNSRVEKFSLDGRYQATFGNARFGPNGRVDIGPLGDVFMAGTSAIQEFNAAGEFLGTLTRLGSGDGQVNGSTDVATDSAGTLFVADVSNNRIEKFVVRDPRPPDPVFLPTVVVDNHDTAIDGDGCGGGDGPAADPCNSLQAGLDVVAEGGTVQVKGSDSAYDPAFAYKKGVSIVGPFEGVPGFVRSDGSAGEAELRNLRVIGPDVTLDGFTFSGGEPLTLDSTGASVLDNVFQDNYGAAILASGSDQLITLNEFDGTSPILPREAVDGSIYAVNITGLEISANEFGKNNSSPAIKIGGGRVQSSDITIDSNVSFQNQGFQIHKVYAADVTNNFLFDLQGEVKLQANGSEVAGLLLDNINEMVVSGNAIYGSPVAIQLGSMAPPALSDITDVEIRGNDLVDNGVSDSLAPNGAIYVTQIAKPGISVVANRIAGNSWGLFVGSYGYGFVPAANNWWGCNEGPDSPDCDAVNENVHPDPWLVFSFGATPLNVPVPGSSQLRADFLTNSDGQRPADAVDFPSVEVDLTKVSGPGAISQSPIITSNGVATGTLSSSQPGTAELEADFDYQSVNTTVAFAAPPATVRAHDVVLPAFESAVVTPNVFAVDQQGFAETPVAARLQLGTTFRYALSEDARVTFTIHRSFRGRKVHGRCRRRTTRNRRKKRCSRYTVVGRFAVQSKQGTNVKRFAGKIGRKSLRPGRYRATLVATDATGNRSLPERVKFRVATRRSS